MRVVRYWHQLPRKVVDALFLGTFKATLDGALGNLWPKKLVAHSWKVSLHRVGVLELCVVFNVLL